MPTNNETGTEVGERLTRLQEDSGLSWKRVARLVQNSLGLYAPSDETLRTWAGGKVNPERMDPVVVTAIADVFGCTVADISTTAARVLRRLEHLRGRVDIDLTGETADEDVSGLGWRWDQAEGPSERWVQDDLFGGAANGPNDPWRIFTCDNSPSPLSQPLINSGRSKAA